MAVISRGSKPSAGGGSDFVDGGVIEAAELNTDFDTVYTLVNGNLDDANIANDAITTVKILDGAVTNAKVSASAAIAATKIDDSSSNAAAAIATDDPGRSGSHNLAVSLEEEIQQLRYVIERISLGIDAQRVDASGTATSAWLDVPARGANLIYNGSFEAHQLGTANAPNGWTLIDTPGTVAQATGLQGDGKSINIVGDAATTQGIYQTLSGLKASTRYLVVCLAKAAVGSAHLVTTGADATSDYRDIDVSTSSATAVPLIGVIQTDATPTNVAIRLTTNGGATDDVTFDCVGVFECAVDLRAESGVVVVEATEAAGTAYAVGTTTWTPSPAAPAVTVPGNGYIVEVDAFMNVATTTTPVAGATFVMNLQEDVSGGGYSTVKSAITGVYAAGTTGLGGNLHVHRKLLGTPGATYTYRLQAVVTTANFQTTTGASTVTVTLRRA